MATIDSYTIFVSLIKKVDIAKSVTIESSASSDPLNTNDDADNSANIDSLATLDLTGSLARQIESGVIIADRMKANRIPYDCLREARVEFSRDSFIANKNMDPTTIAEWDFNVAQEVMDSIRKVYPGRFKDWSIALLEHPRPLIYNYEAFLPARHLKTFLILLDNFMQCNGLRYPTANDVEVAIASCVDLEAE